MVAVGLAWPVLVALTPAADRPWISGTQDNSIWSLILGYNGIRTPSAASRADPAAVVDRAGGGGAQFGGSGGSVPPPQRRARRAGAGGCSALRSSRAIAVVAATRPAAQRRAQRLGDRRRRRPSPRTAVAFSFAQGIFHPYYVSLLAPFGAAPGGRRDRPDARGATCRARVFAPLALVAGAGTENRGAGREPPASCHGLPPVLVLALVPAAAALASTGAARWRNGGVGNRLRDLADRPRQLVDPDARARKPAERSPRGGPASASMGGGPGRLWRRRRSLRRRRRSLRKAAPQPAGGGRRRPARRRVSPAARARADRQPAAAPADRLHPVRCRAGGLRFGGGGAFGGKQRRT